MVFVACCLRSSHTRCAVRGLGFGAWGSLAFTFSILEGGRVRGLRIFVAAGVYGPRFGAQGVQLPS